MSLNEAQSQDVSRMLEGDQRALSRLLTLLERGGADATALMRAVHGHTGRAYCIGVTGPPGAGKSTIVDGLTALWRADGLSVGILAVDPSSPFSGGALLGDRLRMQRHYLDSGVFIRSMASHGESGGLPLAVRGAARLLDTAGKAMVAVETVGVGQAELRVMGVADTVVVTLTPEAGDAIQTLKAGLSEIADILVVNKADREGASRLAEALAASAQMGASREGWTPPVLTTQAHTGAGLPELLQAIERHRRWMESTSLLARRRAARRREEAVELVERAVSQRIRTHIQSNAALRDSLAAAERGERDPYSCAEELLARLLPDWPEG